MVQAGGLSCRRLVLSTPSADVRKPARRILYGRSPALTSLSSYERSRHQLVDPSWSRRCTIPNISQQRSFSKMTESNAWWTGMPSNVSQDSADKSPKSKPIKILPESSEDAEHLPTRRIHILGLGSIGTLVAHSLRCLPNRPPITLLMHKKSMYSAFNRGGRILRLLNPKSQVNDEQMNYDVDVLDEDGDGSLPHWTYIGDTDGGKASMPPAQAEKMDTDELYIYNLIVSVKGPATVNALKSIKHRTSKSTTICFMQNGMGQIDDINKYVFTDPATRPTYMLGIVSHGAYMHKPFTVVHAGFGSTALGIWRDPDIYPLPPKGSSHNPEALSEADRKRFYPSDDELYSSLSSRYLLRTLTRSPVLACAAYPYLDLMQLQLEKLATNAVLNPLTALLDVPNGNMLEGPELSRIQRLLLAEISLVIRSLPELVDIPGVNFRFSAGRLENIMRSIAGRTAQNSSSMREDIRNLRETEIEYINGYVVRRGEEIGLKCVLNYMLMQLVMSKCNLARSQSRQSYGVSMIEGDDSDPEQVILEDTGTKLPGQAY